LKLLETVHIEFELDLMVRNIALTGNFSINGKGNFQAFLSARAIRKTQ